MDGELERRYAEDLEARGIRVTRPRLEVYGALVRSEDHPTASEIHERVRGSAPSISLATVYNCLDALQSAGLVGVMNEVHRAARYDAVTRLHHHLVCRSCGRVADLHDPQLDRLSPAEDRGFEIRDHSVHFYGHCPECTVES